MFRAAPKSGATAGRIGGRHGDRRGLVEDARGLSRIGLSSEIAELTISFLVQESCTVSGL